MAGREGTLAPLLEINDLRLTLGGFTLGSVTLSLEEGDYMVLLGPTGCGKTSLLRAIVGIYAAGPGRIRLDDKDMSGVPLHKRDIGYVAQIANLFPHMNVARNIEFGLACRGVARRDRGEKVRGIAEMLKITKLLDRDTWNLSGGESRLVSLARSLVVDPRVLLLDEPLSGLHHTARTDMLSILRTVHEDLGTATIHVTHNRDEAWAFGERCAVMREGGIEQVGAVEELFRRPKTRFVAEFLGDANVFPATFEQDASGWIAKVAWGEFRLPEPPEGSRGYLQIRPDSLALTEEGGDIFGVARAVRDQGMLSELDLAVPNGETLRVHLLTTACKGIAPGANVALKLSSPPHPIVE